MSALAANVREILNGIEAELRQSRVLGLSVDDVQQLDAEHRHLVVSADRATDFETFSRLQAQAEDFGRRVRRLRSSLSVELPPVREISPTRRQERPSPLSLNNCRL